MGVSTDAIIAFGVDFGEDQPFPWHDDDLEDWWAAQHGIIRPAVEFTEDTKPLFHEYWDKKRECFTKCPVREITHCSGEYPMYILAATETRQLASRGYPIELAPHNLAELGEARKEAFLNFCTRYHIDLPKPPAWLLFSMWS